MKLKNFSARQHNYITCNVYRCCQAADHTCDGVSSRHNRLKVYFADEAGIEVDLSALDNNSVILVKKTQAGVESVIAYPIDALLNDGNEDRPHKGYMFGGNFVYTCDPAFSEFSGIYGAIPIHDRHEAWKLSADSLQNPR